MEMVHLKELTQSRPIVSGEIQTGQTPKLMEMVLPFLYR
jgi:hypothetical protein